ncbi:type III pantothenate kinase [Campylobacter sp. RM16192]|uniref:type III pantothenate kinase n=1 Tax=Campylobacter sp. RM16192 TaxID=1660080 RepID=UPI0014521776|nr:type III pantothenate kinase [Campylobacter sp. RM16192]QCD53070.1 pantothenate kinase, type III [Campylobacter sp. RM16192]
MILCDIGNTNATIFEDGKISKIGIDKFQNFKRNEKIYYISVNDSINQKLQNDKNFVNLEPFFEIDTIYKTLGIDRVVNCYSIDDGVIVDAGSAITIDVMASKMHLGGCIVPGISQSLKAYENISPRLKIALNSQIQLDALPQKTADAISYGIVKPIVLLIENISNNSKIYFTGGDGEFLSRFFKNGIYDRLLIFRGMQKLIEEKEIL